MASDISTFMKKTKANKATAKYYLEVFDDVNTAIAMYKENNPQPAPTNDNHSADAALAASLAYQDDDDVRAPIRRNYESMLTDDYDSPFTNTNMSTLDHGKLVGNYNGFLS